MIPVWSQPVPNMVQQVPHTAFLAPKLAHVPFESCVCGHLMRKRVFEFLPEGLRCLAAFETSLDVVEWNCDHQIQVRSKNPVKRTRTVLQELDVCKQELSFYPLTTTSTLQIIKHASVGRKKRRTHRFDSDK